MTEDEELLRKLRRSDTAAVERIIEKYSNYVAAVILDRLSGTASSEDIEELASNVFFSLWQHRKGLRTDNLRGWLAAAARNGASSFLRKRRFETLDVDDCLDLASDENIDVRIEKSERSEYLRKTLWQLEPQSREVFIRRYYYGQTLSEISDSLSLNLSTVKSRLSRGREKLREELIKGGYSLEN